MILIISETVREPPKTQEKQKTCDFSFLFSADQARTALMARNKMRMLKVENNKDFAFARKKHAVV